MFKFLHRRKMKRKRMQEDLYASSVFVNPLLNKLKYSVPFSQYSVRPFSIAVLCNEILMNRRFSYLEFGGGVSTIIIAKFIQTNDLKTKITVVEDNKDWMELSRRNIEKEGLSEIVEFVHSDLTNCESPLGLLNWYDQETLSKKLQHKFDLVFVDGPPGRGFYHRYFALPFLTSNDLLKESHAFYLDDFNRKQEKKIVEQWSGEYQIEFKDILEQLAYYQKGESLKVKLTNS